MKKLNSKKYSTKERQTARKAILEEYPIDDRDLEEIIHRDIKIKYVNAKNIVAFFLATLRRLDILDAILDDDWWAYGEEPDQSFIEAIVKPPKGWRYDYYTGNVYRLPKQIR